MWIKVHFTDGKETGVMHSGEALAGILEAYGYPHKVGIDCIILHHHDGTRKTFVPE